MAESNVKLLGLWPSPYVLRARIALNMKSVDYEYFEEDYEAKSQLLLESNPVHKLVPVLIHKGKPICESLVIVEYIDEVWSSAPSILPSRPYDRAIARFWGAYVDDKLIPVIKNMIAAEEERRDEIVKKLKEGVMMLEEELVKSSKGKEFFGGDEIGYVDIAFGSNLGWLRAIEKMAQTQILDEANTPSLCKWAHSFSSHPAVKDVLPETNKLLDFAKFLAAKFKPA